MKAIEIAGGIYRIGANITNGDLFEGLWPIPDGVSLNAYLVRGEKTALVDLVRDWDEAPLRLREQLESIGTSVREVDYLILNHLEPDHSGWINTLRDINPGIRIVTTAKGAALVKAFYGIDTGVQTVKSGDRLDLGSGKTLVFEEIPNVHWPETMVTYEPSTGVLFSCDAFGSFGSVGVQVFDDQISENQHDFFESETLRYYANIVASFSAFVERAIGRLADLDVRVLAPSHGIIWRGDIRCIIDRYSRYAAFAAGPAEPEITFVWGSMYGNTEKAVDAVLEGAVQEGVRVNVHRVPQTHLSYILASAWKSTGLIFGMPTYEYRAFPPVAHVIDDLGRKRVFGKKVFRFGSFGWSGGAQKEFEELSSKYKWDFIPAHEFQGSPGAGDLEVIRQRSSELARAVKAAAYRG